MFSCTKINEKHYTTWSWIRSRSHRVSTIPLIYTPFFSKYQTVHSWNTAISIYLEIQIPGQSHARGQTSSSNSGTNIPSTDIPFVPCQSALAFLRYVFFKILLWKLMVIFMAVVKWRVYVVEPAYNWFSSFLVHVNLTIQLFQHWPWKPQGQRPWATVLTSNQCTSLSCYVNRTNHS